MLASLERGDPGARDRATSIGRALGGLEVQVQGEACAWRTVETVPETGPLAADVKLVRLPDPPAGPARLRLRAARVLLRLDAALLARLVERVGSVRLEPAEVRGGALRADDARKALLDPARTAISGPGDRCTLRYRLPADAARLELLLESRGVRCASWRPPMHVSAPGARNGSGGADLDIREAWARGHGRRRPRGRCARRGRLGERAACGLRHAASPRAANGPAPNLRLSRSTTASPRGCAPRRCTSRGGWSRPDEPR